MTENLALREAIIETARSMNRLGINVNKSGNVSARAQEAGSEGFLVTPTGVPYEDLSPADLAFVPLQAGSPEQARGPFLPSSEWMMHRDLYRSRDFGAVVHTHSAHATALSCRGEPIPAFHYMVCAAGGDRIPCARYALFGTRELSESVLEAMRGLRGCLMAHHGVLAAGCGLRHALSLAVEIENLARTYILARSLGPVEILSPAQMQAVQERFRTYGQPARSLDHGA